MNSSKESVKGVFDALAEKKAWEGLYSGKIDRLSYNFVTRQRAVEALLDPVTKGVVLDIGCGTGDLVPFYVKKKTIYTGLDLSPQMVERAKNNYSKEVSAGIAKFVAGDCENLPFESGSVDVLSAVALIEYLPDSGKVLNEVKRVLKPGGYALITVPHKSAINFKIRDLLAPIRKLLFPLYALLKGGSLGVMKDVKHFHYDPEELDAFMKERGFEKRGHRFTNFYLIPHPFDHLFPGTYMKLSENIDNSGRGDAYKAWAVNYIALYKK